MLIELVILYKLSDDSLTYEIIPLPQWNSKWLLYFLYLIEIKFHFCLASENINRDFDFAFGLVDFFDFSLEVRKWPFHYFNSIADCKFNFHLARSHTHLFQDKVNFLIQ